jgi:redox-sensitive bicupin YhaK (pirin superfamily)
VPHACRDSLGTEQPVRPGQLNLMTAGHGVSHAEEAARVLLLGGEPFAEPILLWWNFVAHGREELTAAYRQWQRGDGRFGEVPTHLDRIPAPPPPWTAG